MFTDEGELDVTIFAQFAVFVVLLVYDDFKILGFSGVLRVEVIDLHKLD